MYKAISLQKVFLNVTVMYMWKASIAKNNYEEVYFSVIVSQFLETFAAEYRKELRQTTTVV